MRAQILVFKAPGQGKSFLVNLLIGCTDSDKYNLWLRILVTMIGEALATGPDDQVRGVSTWPGQIVFGKSVDWLIKAV